jgi:hypothetical protein
MNHLQETFKRDFQRLQALLVSGYVCKNCPDERSRIENRLTSTLVVVVVIVVSSSSGGDFRRICRAARR